MTTIKQQTTSELALQKAEDNKKEITYIYSKLKDLHVEVESLKVGNDNNKDERKQLEELNFEPKYLNFAGGQTMISASKTLGLNSKPILIKCFEAGLYNIKINYQFYISKSYGNFIQSYIYIDDELKNTCVCKNSNGTVDGFENEIITTLTYLSEGNHYIYFNVLSIGNVSNIPILKIFTTIESACPVQVITNTCDPQIITNGETFFFKFGINRGTKYITFSSSDALLSFNHTLNYSDCENMVGENIDACYMPVLNEETGTFEKGTEIYYAKNGKNGIAELYCLADGTRILKYGSCVRDENCISIMPYVFGENAGIFLFANFNTDVIIQYSTTLATSFINNKSSLPQFVYLATPKNFDKEILYPHCFGVEENGNCYYIPFKMVNSKIVVDYDNVKLISTQIYLPHIYFYDNQYVMFYNNKGVTRKKIFSITNHDYVEIEDVFYSFAQEVILANKTISVQLMNGVYVFNQL